MLKPIYVLPFLILLSACNKKECAPKKKEVSKYLEAYEEKAQASLKLAEKFLAEQSEHKILIPGKLIYKILSPGDGPIVEENSSPLLHFTERDMDGDILFDTFKQNSPLHLPLTETILGFKLGVTGMKAGERREIYVHPDLAYKKLGKTRPNQLLIYDVTVLEE